MIFSAKNLNRIGE